MILIILSLSLLAFTFCFSQEINSIPENALNKICSNYGIIGAAIGFENPGNKMTFSYGYADKNKKIPMKPDTYITAASICKTFNAVGLMILWQKGLVSLDEDVSRYLGYQLRNPYYPFHKITLRHLMTHTAGLIDTTNYVEFLKKTSSDVNLPFKELLLKEGKFYKADLWKNSPPGKCFSYANISSGIIACIIEKISGLRFDIYMKKNVFTPLEIHRGYSDWEIYKGTNLSCTYAYLTNKNKWITYNGLVNRPRIINRRDQNYHLGMNGLAYNPQGSLNIIPTDLFSLIDLLIETDLEKKKILHPWAIEEMLKIQWEGTGDPDHLYYKKKGLNLLITDEIVPGHRLYGHTGRKNGMVGAFFADPVQKKGGYVLINGMINDSRGSSAYFRVVEEIFQLLWNRDEK